MAVLGGSYLVSKIRVPSCMPVVLIFAMAMCRMVRQRRGRYTIDMEASEARETMSRVLPPQRSLQVKLMQPSLGSGAARDRICEPCERARSEDDRVEKPAPALIHRPCWCKIKELPLINISAIRACSPTKQQRLSGIRQRTRGITFEKPPDRTRNAPPTIGTGEGSSQHTD